MKDVTSKLLKLYNFLKTSGMEEEAETLSSFTEPSSEEVDIYGGKMTGPSSFRLNMSDLENEFRGPDKIDKSVNIPKINMPKSIHPIKPWKDRFEKALKERNYVIDQAEAYIDGLANLQEINLNEVTSTVQRFLHFDKNFTRWKINPDNLLSPEEIKNVYEYFAEKKLKEIHERNTIARSVFNRSVHEESIEAKKHIKEFWKVPANIYEDIVKGKYWEIV